jgi:hypothetical protein
LGYEKACWPDVARVGGQFGATVTRKKVAGMEVAFLSGLLF